MTDFARSGPVKLVAALLVFHVSIMAALGVPMSIIAGTLAGTYAAAGVLIVTIVRMPRLRHAVGIPTCRRVGCDRAGLGVTFMCSRHQKEEQADT